jgi:hypothetical protein
MSSMGPLLTPPNNVMLWMLLRNRLDRSTFRVDEVPQGFGGGRRGGGGFIGG